jgi:hypothetical protein
VATSLLARQKDTTKSWNPKFGLIIEYAFTQGLLTNEQASEYACRAWEFGPINGKLSIRVGNFNDQVDISLAFLPTRGGPYQDTIAPRLGQVLAAASIVQIEVDGKVMPLDSNQGPGLGDRSPPGEEELIGKMSPKRLIDPSTLVYSYAGPGGTGVSATCMVPPSDKPRTIVIRTRVRVDEGLAATRSSKQSSAASMEQASGSGASQEPKPLSWTREDELRVTLAPGGKPVRWVRHEDLAVPLEKQIDVEELAIPGMTAKARKSLLGTSLTLTAREPLPALLIGRIELRTVGTSSMPSNVVASSHTDQRGSSWIRFEKSSDGLTRALETVRSIGVDGSNPIPDEPLDVWFVPDTSASREIEGARRFQLDGSPVFDVLVSEVRLGQIRRRQ